MKMLKDSKAVSPVIGVMLMLVVTVILAAAVSSTSSGLMKSSDAAPSAVFDVKVVMTPAGSMGNPDPSMMTITEVTGDAIDTKDLKIVTINPNAAGDNKTMEVVPGEINCCRVSSKGIISYGIMPYLNNGVTYFGTQTEAGFAKNFGNYTLKPGVIMVADNYGYTDSNNVYSYTAPLWNAATGAYEGDEDERTGMQAMFADWANVSSGDFVTIKIIHTPTQKVIYQSEVEVE
ncbi:type IV pilin N-terminal domain-containing protein [uncultured Methanomethylovorans sp.]|uniref:type IV pilin N-terminal domain-containing protein n=1 Tax=uncultured Methanomethylovorans sp. TaxID=183759 RepID=UPI002AA83C3E|nr:type IV pilin N-terminal domain-containing protein [uncultured Methanomethylovorans sp.]